MSRHAKSISFSLEPEIIDKLSYTKKILNLKSRSGVVKLLVNKFIHLLEKEDYTTVILKVPDELKSDPNSLKKWMDAKVLVLVDSLKTVKN